jgi:hypothetical protein
MISFLLTIKSRNETLFYFGLICLLLSILFLFLSRVTATQVYGVNAWYKPFKFAFSIFIYVWTMSWIVFYLPSFPITFFNWVIIILLGLEILYIAIQAGRGQLSHYNVSTLFYSFLYVLMAIAATLVTIYTAYIAYLFCVGTFPLLPDYYVWALRMGLIIFVIFSFQGFLMGSRLNHSVGALNDNSNIFILGWSKTVGDLRIAHFVGMHALQVLPLLSFYVLRNTKATMVVSVLYVLLALVTLLQALQGKPWIKDKCEIAEK